MEQPIYNPGDRIVIKEGKHAGRPGEYLKNCSSVFPEYCKVKLDLTKRERIQKVLMIKKVEIGHE